MSSSSLRRVLEVRVHDADPLAARDPDACDDRAAEPALALPGGRWISWTARVESIAPDRVRRLVVAVVDEDDLDRQVGQHPLQPRDERPDVLRPLPASGSTTEIARRLDRSQTPLRSAAGEAPSVVQSDSVLARLECGT